MQADGSSGSQFEGGGQAAGEMVPPPSAGAPALGAQRRLLQTLTLLAVALLIGSVVWFSWHERQQEIQTATDQSVRRAARLAEDLSQVLRLAQVVIDQAEARLQSLPSGAPLEGLLGDAPFERAQLLAALPLPFELHALDREGHALGLAPGSVGHSHDGADNGALPATAAPAGRSRWQVGTAIGTPQARVIPLRREAAPNRHGVTAFAVDLSHAAVLRRFDDERLQPGGAVALFRFERDGGATLLARAPHSEQQLGQRVHGPLAQGLVQAPAGVFSAVTQIDRVHRLVAYRRLDGAAADLVIAYGISTDTLLAGWHRSLPWSAAITLLLAAGMLWGGRRLDRSMQALATNQRALERSESHFRALAGNLPDVVVRLDPDGRHLYANAAVRQATGLEPAAFIGKTNAELGMPPENVSVWMAALARVFGSGRAERLEFAYPGPQGPRHWESIVTLEPSLEGTERSALVISRDITERMQAAAARQALSTQLVELLEGMNDGFVSLDRQGCYRYVNRKAGQMLGREPADLVGKHIWTEFPESVGQPFHRAYERAMNEGVSVQIEEHYAPSDAWFEDRIHPTADGISIFFTDITERVRAVHALGASQARLAYLLRRAPTVIYTARPEGDYAATYYSPTVRDMLGWSPETFLSDPAFWIDHVHGDDREGVLQALGALATQDDLTLEYRFLHADGRWRWMRDAVSMARDDAGRPTELVGSWIDITERREAEEAARRLAAGLEQRVQERTTQLALSEARYRAIFEAVPVAIGEEDWTGVQALLRELRARGVSDGVAYFAQHPEFVQQCLVAVRIVRLNPKALALHDARDKDAELPDLQSFYPSPEDLPQFVGELEAMWTGQRLYTAKKSLPAVSGRPLSLMLSISLPALDDADGTALTCLVDITEIDRLNAELDRSLARLRQANKELETFTYSVSHDLKAPLRGIDGYSRLLLTDHQERLDDEARQFLAHIRRAAQHMGVLIDDLLAYSRLERRELTLAPLALRELVDSVLEPYRNDVAAQGVELRVEVPEALRALGDAQGLAIALRNLIDNALKFSRDSRPARIGIAASSSGSAVRLAVRDNGLGFDMKFHDRIFSIFQRLHRAEDYPGTGVGLAIVRKAMERMGGRVWAESAPRQGATFTLELPEAA